MRGSRRADLLGTRAPLGRRFHRSIESEIVIAASPQRVWEVLTEFAAYPSWNPFIAPVSGTPRPGERLRATAWPRRGLGLAFSAVVTASSPARELRWRGEFFFPWLFHGCHHFLIEELPSGRSLLRQGEVLGGLLVPVIGAVMAAWMRPGFLRMNEALKARAELEDGKDGAELEDGKDGQDF